MTIKSLQPIKLIDRVYQMLCCIVKILNGQSNLYFCPWNLCVGLIGL